MPGSPWRTIVEVQPEIPLPLSIPSLARPAASAQGDPRASSGGTQLSALRVDRNGYRGTIDAVAPARPRNWRADVWNQGFRRQSPSLASSASSSFSAMGTSTVAGSIGNGVDGTGQRQMLSDRYALGEELGRGAFGQVFKGMDTRSGEAVAIKQM